MTLHFDIDVAGAKDADQPLKLFSSFNGSTAFERSSQWPFNATCQQDRSLGEKSLISSGDE